MRIMKKLRQVKQSLRRDAPAIKAFTAGSRCHVHHGDIETKIRCPKSSRIAARSAPNDQDLCLLHQLTHHHGPKPPWKSEARISKSETMTKIPIVKTGGTVVGFLFWSLDHSNLGFVSDFEFRIS